MSMSVVVRAPLYCASCGSAIVMKVLNTRQREVWCIQRDCNQYDVHGVIDDPVITHLSPGVMAAMHTAIDLNPQPREH